MLSPGGENGPLHTSPVPVPNISTTQHERCGKQFRHIGGSSSTVCLLTFAYQFVDKAEPSV